MKLSTPEDLGSALHRMDSRRIYSMIERFGLQGSIGQDNRHYRVVNPDVALSILLQAKHRLGGAFLGHLPHRYFPPFLRRANPDPAAVARLIERMGWGTSGSATDATSVAARPLPSPEPKPSPAPRVAPRIQVGIFFDGTDNNRERDRPQGHDTNISKLFDLFHQDGKTRYAFYLEGVGSGGYEASDPLTGGIFGRGIQERIERAAGFLRDLLAQHPGAKVQLSLFGFSRGAATVLSFVNQLFGKTRSLLATGQLPFEQVWFVGLFDTVGSIGVPGTDDNFGHDLGVVPSRIRSLAHLTSRNELREFFPLTSVRIGPHAPLPENWMETAFPGVHSDVGGGYEGEFQPFEVHSSDPAADHTAVDLHIDKRDYLSRVPGWAMYDAARKTGVPMRAVTTQMGRPPGESLVLQLQGEAPPGETNDNGWTLFKVEESARVDAQIALDHLSIPPALTELWTVRNNESDRLRRTDPEHPEYATCIAPYIHDSLNFEDPNTYRPMGGKAILPRKIFYRGAAYVQPPIQDPAHTIGTPDPGSLHFS